MKYIRLHNNTVIEVIDFNPDGIFHSSIEWHSCSNDSVVQGWTTDGENFFPPEVVTPVTPVSDIAAQKLIKIAELAAFRYEKEIAGITVSETVIKTDRESQSLLTGAWTAAQMNPDISIEWKGVDGWVTLNKTQITAISEAVVSHVQACFSREKALTTLIEADVDTDITTGWPNE